jgi:hypothetical protein
MQQLEAGHGSKLLTPQMKGRGRRKEGLGAYTVTQKKQPGRNENTVPIDNKNKY